MRDGMTQVDCAKQFARKLADELRRLVPDDELTELMAAYTAGAAISHEDGIATLTKQSCWPRRRCTAESSEAHRTVTLPRSTPGR